MKGIKLLFTALAVTAMLLSGITCYAVDESAVGGYAAVDAEGASAVGGCAAIDGEGGAAVAEGEKLDTPTGIGDDSGNTETPTVITEGNAGETASGNNTAITSPDDNAEGTSSGNTETEGEDTNPFAVVLGKLLEYGTEIICTLTLFGSLLLGYAYKKGLVPLVSSMLNALRGAIGNAEKESAKRETDEGVRFATLKSALDGIEERINTVSENIEESALRLAALAREGSATEAIRVILKEEVELLSDVFMSSSLPQYKKDAVGERLALMKEELKKYEE